MKKLTIKEVFTRVEYKEVVIENGKEMLKDSHELMLGRVSKKNAIKLISEKNYLVNSVKITVKSDTYKIPYDVLEDLIHASINGGFVDTEDDRTSLLIFGKSITYRSWITPLNIVKTEIVEVEDKLEYDGAKRGDEFGVVISHIMIPTEVYNHIYETYKV